jgi:hypothetical protein
LELTLKMDCGHRATRVRRIAFGADDERLTPVVGLVVIGAITRTLGLVGLIDGELARERRAAAVKGACARRIGRRAAGGCGGVSADRRRVL